MTQDRSRPLAAFVLVSLLCAVILSLNLGRERGPVVVSDRTAHAQLVASKVVFGDTLAPRAAAASEVPPSTTGVGPLNDAVVRATRVTTTAVARHRAGPAHRGAHARPGTVTKIKTKAKAPHTPTTVAAVVTTQVRASSGSARPAGHATASRAVRSRAARAVVHTTRRHQAARVHAHSAAHGNRHAGTDQYGGQGHWQGWSHATKHPGSSHHGWGSRHSR